MKQYVSIMKESLQKKCSLLDRLIHLNEEQQKKMADGSIPLEEFDLFLDEKDQIIKELDLMDSGFEKLYARVADELSGNTERYAEEIRAMQELIRQITEKSTTVQAQEQRNKALLDSYFKTRREEIRDGRRSSQVALKYYQAQNTGNPYISTYMDDKK